MVCSRASIFTMLLGYCVINASKAAALEAGSWVFSAPIYALYSAGSWIVFWLVGVDEGCEVCASSCRVPPVITTVNPSKKMTKTFFMKCSSADFGIGGGCTYIAPEKKV